MLQMNRTTAMPLFGQGTPAPVDVQLAAAKRANARIRDTARPLGCLRRMTE
jgi:hypothetical protein